MHFFHLFLQVIKNLLFVAKVIYLISPESDVASEEGTKNGGEEQEEREEEEEERENGHGEEEDEEAAQEKEEEEDENENEDRPPSLLWLMKKLLLMAKREAANTPKVPLKVHMLNCAHVSDRVLHFLENLLRKSELLFPSVLHLSNFFFSQLNFL